MNTFRFTRFEKIYSSREEAIGKLNNATRVYAECVTIRYRTARSINTILSLYKSDVKGDYSIVYDSGNPSNTRGRVFNAEKVSGESDEDILNRIMLEEDSIYNWDLVTIQYPNSAKNTYVYIDGAWVPLSSEIAIIGNDSSTVNLTVTKDSSSSTYEIQADIPIDNQSLQVDSNTGILQVGIIDCGKLRDL